MNKLYEVGCYIRLSKENTFADSESIEHQQEMLSKFIDVMPGWIEKKQYIDNGVSGGSFNRPAFLEMMNDVRGGFINLVLVKDLSRFGRNYLEAGRYLEEELPALGCRFVALSDNVDTESGENDIVPFLNAINDFYLKNLSERIKSVLHAKARDGQKLMGTAPYGYLRSEQDHTRLVVDEFAAGIVRRIFDLRVHGMGYAKIAAHLNTDGILPPRMYYFTRQKRETPWKLTEMWYSQTIRMILNNEIYIGNTVQNMLATRSHRDDTIVKRPEDEWTRVENTHEAIVDRATWDVVRELAVRAKSKASTQREHRPSLFSGLLVCDGCGSNLVYNAETHTRKNGRKVSYGSYHCRTYALSGGSVCSRHTMYEMTLGRILLEDIRRHAALIRLDEGAMLEALRQKLLGGSAAPKAASSRERRALRDRLHKLEQLTAKLYEDRVMGIISEERFSLLAEKSEAERLEKEKRLSLLEQSEQETTAKLADIQTWMRLIQEKAALENVDRELLECLVERIEIGERRVVDGVKTQDVRIVYRFVGSVGGEGND